MKNEKEIIQLWKELQITHIDFEFSCGGDSMNDTTLNIHKGDDQYVHSCRECHLAV